VQRRFLKPQKLTKIGLKNQVVLEIGGKITVFDLGKNDFWFELSEGSKNRGFEKPGLQCTHFTIQSVISC